MTIKEKIMRIMDLALSINDPEVPDVGKTKTAVFVDWSSHCNLLSVRIYYGGWCRDSSDSCDYDELIDVYYSSEKLDSTIRLLEYILNSES